MLNDHFFLWACQVVWNPSRQIGFAGATPVRSTGLSDHLDLDFMI